MRDPESTLHDEIDSLRRKLAEAVGALSDIEGGHNLSPEANACIEVGDAVAFRAAFMTWAQSRARATLAKLKESHDAQ